MKIGDKVVCVDDSPCRNRGSEWFGCESPIISGKIYVIRSIFTPVQNLLVRLVGVDLPLYDGVEMGFNSNRFRLLTELKSRNTKQAEDKRV